MGGENCNSTISSHQMLFSEKNCVDHFLVRSALEFDHHECQIAHSKGEDKDEEGRDQLQISGEEKQEDNFDMFVSSLKVKIPSAGEFCRVQQDGNIGDGDGDVDDVGLKTPTSLDQKITVSLQCPPAPRKPKSLPLKKRKAGHPRISLHLSSEIESLFPPVDDLLADLGGMIKKKVRVEG